MPTGPASTADEIADNIKALIERIADAKFTQDMARRGQDVGDRAADAWRDAEPLRRDAAKRLSRATDDAARTWRKQVRPALKDMVKDMWSRRTLAMGAAGAAVPAGRELVDTAAVRLGLRQQEERHWGAFFLGLVLGAIGGAIAALLLTPKRGDEMRRELAVKADEVRQEVATRADEFAAKAKDAEWVPIFQRDGDTDEVTNGQPTEAADVVTEATASVQEAAADAGTATGEVAEQVADETADAINESYDTVDRETRS